jgi:hypothetical protein
LLSWKKRTKQSTDGKEKIATEALESERDAIRESLLAIKTADRSREGHSTYMQLEEALTYRGMARYARKLVLEECEMKNEALFKIEVMKRKRNPGRKSSGKIGRPRKVAATSVFADVELQLAQNRCPDYSLMDAD